MNRLLSNVWKKPGTANGMKPETEGIDTIGKTGTTSDFKDYTFAGVPHTIPPLCGGAMISLQHVGCGWHPGQQR